MRLTRENTAIVLDSTSDFVDARDRHANMRLVPLYVLFDGEALRDHVDISSEGFYERLATAKTLPTTSQPTPADFLATYEELAASGFDRIWSLHLTSKLSGTFESAQRAAAQLGDDRVRVVDTETASLVSRDARGGDRPAARDGTTDEEVEELVDRFKSSNRVVFTVATLEYLQKGGRIGKAQALAGLAAQRQADPDGRGRRDRPARPRPWTPEGTRGVREALRSRDRGRRRIGLHVAIAHANAPEWVDVLTDMARRVRPKATVDLVEPLGAVVGTHAGPGAVGFFWFQD